MKQGKKIRRQTYNPGFYRYIKNGIMRNEKGNAWDIDLAGIEAKWEIVEGYEVEKELDIQFPKGDKARGRALALVAMANIVKELAIEKVFKDINKALKDTDLKIVFKNRLKEIKDKHLTK